MQNLHPLFVHFPIALLSTGVLCDLLAIFLKRDSLREAGWWMQLFGVGGAMAAVGSGMMAEDTVTLSVMSSQAFDIHQILMITATIVFTVLVVWRAFLHAQLPQRKTAKRFFILLYGAAVLTMFAGAYYGGRMVYDYGVGAAQEKVVAPAAPVPGRK